MKGFGDAVMFWGFLIQVFASWVYSYCENLLNCILIISSLVYIFHVLIKSSIKKFVLNTKRKTSTILTSMLHD
jgi:hypothetical protein